ncbi:MAG: MFS transporter [Nocardioidaceae bacterium]
MRRRTSGSPGPGPDPLRGRDFRLLLLATFGAVSNYATLLSVVPLWAASGGSGGTGVGATTGVVMGATVLSQLAMGRLFRVLSLRQLLAVGAALMAVATPAYALSDSLLPVLAVSAVRGVGFGLVVVAGGALTAELIPNAQLGKGVGWYGLSTGLPSVVCLPAGVWVAQEVGYVPVFVVTSALAFVAIPVILGVGHCPPKRAATARGVTERPGRLRSLMPSWTLMIPGAVGLGGISTFLPLALEHPATASIALFAVSIGVITGRLSAGAAADVIGSGQLLLPAVVASSLGMAGIAVVTGTGASGMLAPLAAITYGLGWGFVQNDTLVIMLRRAGPGGHGLASTVWNIAFDGGTGVGAVLLGLIVALAGHAWAFAVAAALIAVTTPLAWWEGRRA